MVELFTQASAWLAVILTFCAYYMKTMVPLRLIAIGSNICFIAYGLFAMHGGFFQVVQQVFFLHVALLPVNLMRLNELRKLISSVRSMQSNERGYEFMVPFMTPVRHSAGSFLFRQGDKAKDVYILKSGRLLLTELNKELPEGSLFGEVAVFAESAKRTASVQCLTDCELLRISGSKVVDLFYQDRRFAFQITRMMAGYARPKATVDPGVTTQSLPASAAQRLSSS